MFSVNYPQCFTEATQTSCCAFISPDDIFLTESEHVKRSSLM